MQSEEMGLLLAEAEYFPIFPHAQFRGNLTKTRVQSDAL
jgi:hypothetical protein